MDAAGPVKVCEVRRTEVLLPWWGCLTGQYNAIGPEVRFTIPYIIPNILLLFFKGLNSVLHNMNDEFIQQ